MTTFRWAGSSDTGQVRSVNQDSWYATDGFFVVADGMGGHRGGEVASAVAVESLRSMSDDVGEPSTSQLLDGVLAANEAVLSEAADKPDLRGMGTTLCAVVRIDPPDDGSGSWLAVTNVGDSRVYLWADGELHQITQDHSLVEDLVRQGRLTEDEAAVHPQRNIVTRALGVSEDLEVDYWELPARGGDRFVLCSDGLFNEVGVEQIESVLRRLESPDDVADELVRLANASGGRDNITVVVADVIDPDIDPTRDSLERSIGEPRVRVGEVDVAGFASAVDPDIVATSSSSHPSTLGPLVDDDDNDDDRRRRTPIRTLGWLMAVVTVILVAVIAVGLYARSNYYVDIADDKVVIYQGRPGGVLWFDATVEDVSDIDVDELTPLLREEVEGNPDYASFEGARDYVDDLLGRLPETTSGE